MTRSPAKSPTPILDLESPLPKKFRWDRLTLTQVFLMIIVPAFAVSLLVRVFVALHDSSPGAARALDYVGTKLDTLFTGSGSYSPALFSVAYFLALLVTILIHELGHLCAARAVGFRLQTIRVGPLSLVKSINGLKITVQRRSSFDGSTAIRIQHLRRLHQKFALFSAAGPFANFLSGLCAWLFLAAPLGASHNTIRQSLQLVVALSILIGAANLIPYQRANGMYSDGARLLALVNSRVKTRRLLCILALDMQINSGVRPRHLKQTWIAHSCAIADRSRDALQAFWIAYLAENDRENTEHAAQNLEKCLERFGSASLEFQNQLLIQAAVFQAWFRNNEEKAKCWSQRSQAYAAASPLMRLRLQICIHWAGRRYDEAAAAWERGRVQIETFPASSAKSRLMDAWIAWGREMDRRRATGETSLNC